MTTPADVECVECGESFDPTTGGGWCPACGLYRWEGDAAASGAETPAPDGDADDGGDDRRDCPDCGERVPDGSFCVRCGAALPDPCPDCGTAVQPDWAACPTCGAALPDEGPVERVAFEVGDARVTAADGETVGAHLRTAHVEAGGSAEDARYVHREHVRVVVEGDAAYLVPVGENGTRVNGDRAPVGERRRVRDGDEVTFSGVVAARVRVERGERS
jgi:hypothetical protein